MEDLTNNEALKASFRNLVEAQFELQAKAAAAKEERDVMMKILLGVQGKQQMIEAFLGLSEADEEEEAPTGVKEAAIGTREKVTAGSSAAEPLPAGEGAPPRSHWGTGSPTAATLGHNRDFHEQPSQTVSGPTEAAGLLLTPTG
ncbi:unnamed protein product [Linum trigynum]|uniref:Uncharacterized protein n=1 Tax=Linum trigynum TaxID=586398 RepID=A0AAV2DA44_9ROSI